LEVYRTSVEIFFCQSLLIYDKIRIDRSELIESFSLENQTLDKNID